MADTLYSEDKITAILRAIGGEMLLVNRDGVVQYAETTESVLNSSFQNAEGAFLWDVFSQEIAQRLMLAMSTVFLHNSVQELAIQIEAGEHIASRKAKVVRCGEWEVAILFMSEETTLGNTAEDAKTELRMIYKKIENMSGLIPMCSCCKKIRDSEGFWTQLEVYLQKHANTEITHTMCPNCQEEWYK